MDKKQTLLLGLMALGVSTASVGLANSALDSLQVDTAVESRVKCAPYSVCEDQEVRLSDAEEKAIQRDLAKLNALNIIAVAGLTKTIAPVSGYCYGLPCPGDIEAAQNVKRLKAAKLSKIVETVQAEE